MSEVRVEAIIRGLVQGVGFRESCRRLGHELKVRGWVRNLPDGSVQMVCEGTKEAVERLVQFVHAGPSHAIVESVEITRAVSQDEFSEFKILRGGS